MEAFLVSTSIVALAEMGDKTQLLSFVLAAKLKHRVPIVLGILFATLANHFLAGWIGAWLATLVSPTTLRFTIAASFVAFGLWALKPDELEGDQKLRGAGVFVTTLVAFFLVEMGDKTQIATVALAAQFQSLVMVVIGTTVGMLLANVPVVYAGDALIKRVPLKWVRIIAASVFAALGVYALVFA
jgi:Ca2+/H+ antiporter, TMEM165/GDT1 family